MTEKRPQWIGMASSDVIVAKDMNPEASIFDIADFGIVGGPLELVPAVIEDLKKLQAERWKTSFREGLGYRLS